MKWFLNILFEDKTLIEEMRIIEMNPSDQFNGMVTPLAHAPDRWNSHGKEDKPLHPFRPSPNPLRIEDALGSPLFIGKVFQKIIEHQFIMDGSLFPFYGHQTLDLMPA
jgi:hypothetical protein